MKKYVVSLAMLFVMQNIQAMEIVSSKLSYEDDQKCWSVARYLNKYPTGKTEDESRKIKLFFQDNKCVVLSECVKKYLESPFAINGHKEIYLAKEGGGLEIRTCTPDINALIISYCMRLKKPYKQERCVADQNYNREVKAFNIILDERLKNGLLAKNMSAIYNNFGSYTILFDEKSRELDYIISLQE